MPRAAHPASPADDLAAAVESRSERRHGALTAELAAFCQSGVSIVLGSRGRDGRPVTGRALACTVGTTGVVRVLLSRAPNRALLDGVAAGSAIAATFSRPRDHRSIQLKSSRARIVACDAGDPSIVEAQTKGFCDDLTGCGYPRSFADTYSAWRSDGLIALEFVAEGAFVQTPGPGAGSALP